jgi:hypothetical protein
MVSRPNLVLGIVILGLSLLVCGAYAVRKQVAATLNPEGST